MADIRFQYFSVAVRNLEEGMKRYEKYSACGPLARSPNSDGDSEASCWAPTRAPCSR